MAEILFRTGDFKGAYAQEKESYRIRLSSGAVTISSTEDMGRDAEAVGKTSTALKYYKKALMAIITQEKSNQYIDYLGEQLAFYIASNTWQYAELVFNIIKTCQQNNIPSNVYSAIAIYFQKKGLRDSTLIYTEKALVLDQRFKGKVELAERMARMLAAKGDYNDSYRYSMMSLNYLDSAEAENKVEQVKNVEAQRSIEELREARNVKKEAKKRRQIYGVMIIMVVLIAICVILFILYISYKKKMKLMADIERIASEKNKMISDNAILKNKVLVDRQLRVESSVDVSTVIKNLQNIANSQKEKLQPDMWDAIFNAVDKLHPEFRDHLLSYSSDLENKDLILLYLMKLGFKQADIARIIKRNPSVISRKLRRIEKELGATIREVVHDS